MKNLHIKNRFQAEPDSENIYLQNLEWDSQMLGMRCGIIDCSHISICTHQNILVYRINELLKQNKDFSFITIKLPSSFTHLLNRLISESTHLIDSELIFKFHNTTIQPVVSEVNFVNDVNPDIFVPLADEMVNSRHFLDQRLPKDRVKKLWIESINNHCTGRADQIAVAKTKGKPTGIATIHFTGEHTIQLFIVGVLQEHQHKGVGNDLISAVIQKFSDSKEMFVETSCRNFGAQRLYQKCGFKYNNMRYILHKVSKGY